jgi:hypothetical protein
MTAAANTCFFYQLAASRFVNMMEYSETQAKASAID